MGGEEARRVFEGCYDYMWRPEVGGRFLMPRVKAIDSIYPVPVPLDL